MSNELIGNDSQLMATDHLFTYDGQIEGTAMQHEVATGLQSYSHAHLKATDS
jgi:hypothetical protein